MIINSTPRCCWCWAWYVDPLSPRPAHHALNWRANNNHMQHHIRIYQQYPHRTENGCPSIIAATPCCNLVCTLHRTRPKKIQRNFPRPLRLDLRETILRCRRRIGLQTRPIPDDSSGGNNLPVELKNRHHCYCHTITMTSNHSHNKVWRENRLLSLRMSWFRLQQRQCRRKKICTWLPRLADCEAVPLR